MELLGRDAERRGLLYGALAVAMFSLTLPATRVAVLELGAAFVGLGRILVAAAIAALALVLFRVALPSAAQLKNLAVVGAGVVLGFPLLTSWAMSEVPASHGAVLVGLLPLATACAGAWRAAERPSAAFWASAVTGSVLVVAFALREGAGSLQPADIALLGAVAAAAVGYAEGGRLARTLGGWQTIAWALVMCSPFALIALLIAGAPTSLTQTSFTAWTGFAYVSIVSQFLGFVVWYRGLSIGGIARVSQVQLLQLFLTLGFSWALLNERVSPETAVWGGMAAM